jgi:hypothetical protein
MTGRNCGHEQLVVRTHRSGRADCRRCVVVSA